MSETTKTDEQGRLTIPQTVREKHGERYRIVDLQDRIILIPLQSDPINGFQNAIGAAFHGKTISAVKTKSRRSAREE